MDGDDDEEEEEDEGEEGRRARVLPRGMPKGGKAAVVEGPGGRVRRRAVFGGGTVTVERPDGDDESDDEAGYEVRAAGSL